MACTEPPKTVFNIDDYGALGDGTTLNTSFIQQAIDACSNAGGGTVLIEKGDYVSGTILLKNNVTLQIDKGAMLIGSANPMDYLSIDGFVDATGQNRGKCLIGALDANNISIIGEGKVNGRGDLFVQEHFKKLTQNLNVDKDEFWKHAANRPFLIRFVRSKDIELKGVELRQPAAWTVHYYQCSDALIDGVKIYSHANKNNDGIDLDSSHDIVIKNCDIDSGDDAICFKTTSPKPTYNITVKDCRLKSDWGTIKFGTESMGDFYNIELSNCQIHDTRGGGIKILSVDGANIHDISIDSIQMKNVDMPIFIRLGERLRTYRDATKQKVGSIKSVKISNVTASTRDLENSRISPPSGVFITGTPNHKIEDIKLENISVKLPGGGLEEHQNIQVEEMEEKYPEFSFFKILPASGLYARHITTLSVENLTFQVEGVDEREKIILQDVNEYNILEK